MVDLKDTICALSSAPGRSGIAVVRLSGSHVFDILPKIFSPAGTRDQKRDRQAILGRICDPRDGSEIDEALVTCFHAPHSYTGEDIAEMSVHGSPVVVAELLECLCRLGARLAEPGEFTLRAFLHGRMDLLQAEAVRDVIEAQTLYQLQVATRQRAGELSRRLEPLRGQLTEIVATLEAAIQFVEEDLALEARELLAARLEVVRTAFAKWVESFRLGRIVRDGFSLAIVGGPNVGKSSLFNALLLEDRSIVTEMAGTTRDLVSEFASIEGIPVRLIDTAGLRDGLDRVEQLGIERSLRIMADVDAILLVVDTSRSCSAEDERLRQHLQTLACIVALNKSDLPAVWPAAQREVYEERWPCVAVSALTGAHMDELRGLIKRHLFGDGGQEREGLLVTNLRHCRCLEAAHGYIDQAGEALRRGLSEEFVLVDLQRALQKLGEITGETTVEDILDRIFARFCIGK
jgi:tRNA modification GTPase